MLVVTVSDKKEYRKKCALEYCGGDEISVDNDLMDIFDLEQYAYPSLFDLHTPTIHIRFLLEENEKNLNDSFIKKLVSSPTTFFFEEIALSKDIIKLLERSGAIIYQDKAISKTKAKDNLFYIASSIISTDKKTAWLNYQKAIKEYNIEAILGIMYWKVRDMMIKNSKNLFYKNLYQDLMRAHARSWQMAIPLELSIEKVLLK